MKDNRAVSNSLLRTDPLQIMLLILLFQHKISPHSKYEHATQKIKRKVTLYLTWFIVNSSNIRHKSGQSGFKSEKNHIFCIVVVS